MHETRELTPQELIKLDQEFATFFDTQTELPDYERRLSAVIKEFATHMLDQGVDPRAIWNAISNWGAENGQDWDLLSDLSVRIVMDVQEERWAVTGGKPEAMKRLNDELHHNLLPQVERYVELLSARPDTTPNEVSEALTQVFEQVKATLKLS